MTMWETDKDRDNEIIAIKRWGKVLFPKLQAGKLPVYYHTDFCIKMEDDIPVGLCEVKCRPCKSTRYVSAYVDVLKYDFVYDLSKRHHLQSWVVWWWMEDDVITYINMMDHSEDAWTIRYKKNHDRNNPEDTDLLYEIPQSVQVLLKEV